MSWCPTSIKFPVGQSRFHYVYDAEAGTENMIVMPYKITTYHDYSRIYIHVPPDHPDASQSYKSDKWQFKTVIKRVPPIHSMPADKLLKKIKILVTFS
jgi:hypothetical protein